MKKGLRHRRPHQGGDDTVRTVDLMKKGLRPRGQVELACVGVRTVDLMKKGLRRVTLMSIDNWVESEP